MKIVVIGSSNTDMVIGAPKMPAPGETLMGSDFSIILGGKGANQAVACARAGVTTGFICKVGNDDFGKKAIESYAKDQIETQYIQQTENAPTGVAVITVDQATGQNSIVVAPGANALLNVADIQNSEEAFRKASVALVQLEIPIQTVTESLSLAKQYDCTTVLNPAPAQHLSDDVLNKVDIITPNETETALLVGFDLKTDADIRKAGELLLSKVQQAVIITLGSRGVYCCTKQGETYFVAATPVKAIDTTSAGDVFNGYLVAGLANGRTLKEAITDANKAAAISVTRKGAQPSVPFVSEL